MFIDETVNIFSFPLKNILLWDIEFIDA